MDFPLASMLSPFAKSIFFKRMVADYILVMDDLSEVLTCVVTSRCRTAADYSSRKRGENPAAIAWTLRVASIFAAGRSEQHLFRRRRLLTVIAIVQPTADGSCNPAPVPAPTTAPKTTSKLTDCSDMDTREGRIALKPGRTGSCSDIDTSGACIGRKSRL